MLIPAETSQRTSPDQVKNRPPKISRYSIWPVQIITTLMKMTNQTFNCPPLPHSREGGLAILLHQLAAAAAALALDSHLSPGSGRTRLVLVPSSPSSPTTTPCDLRQVLRPPNSSAQHSALFHLTKMFVLPRVCRQCPEKDQVKSAHPP